MKKSAKKKVVLFIGHFRVTSGKLYVGDPSLAKRLGEGSNIIGKVEQGVWGASVQMIKFGEWGVRPGVLMVACINDNPKVKAWLTSDGVVPVDSGKVTIMDMSYVNPHNDFDGWNSGIYNSIRLSGKQAAIHEAGVTSSSGIGDGFYDLKIGYDAMDRVIAVRVNFARYYGEAGQTRGW